MLALALSCQVVINPPNPTVRLERPPVVAAVTHHMTTMMTAERRLSQLMTLPAPVEACPLR